MHIAILQKKRKKDAYNNNPSAISYHPSPSVVKFLNFSKCTFYNVQNISEKENIKILKNLMIIIKFGFTKA